MRSFRTSTTTAPALVEDPGWLWDGCSQAHLTGNRDIFVPGSLRPCTISVKGAVPGHTSPTLIGKVRMRFKTPAGLSPWVQLDTLLVDGLDCNILSKNRVLKDAQVNPEIITRDYLDFTRVDIDASATPSTADATNASSSDALLVAALRAYATRTSWHGIAKAPSGRDMADARTSHRAAIRAAHDDPRAYVNEKVLIQTDDGPRTARVTMYNSARKWWRARFDDR